MQPASPPQFGELDAGADYVLRPGGYAVIFNDVGAIAVVVTPSGYYLPGGGQDAGESPEAATIREVREETGLQIILGACLGTADQLIFAAAEQLHFRKRCTFYLATVRHQLGPGEVDHQLHWLPPEDAHQRLRDGSQRWAVEQACAQRTRQTLLQQIGVRHGHFRFESGHHGDVWLDLDALFLRPRQLAPLIEDLAHRLVRHEITAICGPMVGGAFLAQSLAQFLDVEFFYAERHGAPANTGLVPVRYQLPAGLRSRVAGKRIALVDDAINACSAIGGSHTDLLSLAAVPIVVGSFLTVGATPAQFARTHNLALETLAELTTNLWPPDACPLCATSLPLDHPAPR